MNNYIIGDINDVIKTFDNNEFNLIYTNPPFNTTAKKWDNPLDWDKLFLEMDRVLKPNGVILLHCSKPFTYDLIRYRKPNYHYTWVKNNPTNFFQAKKQPLRQVEEILVYYKKKHTYNPQMIGDQQMTNNRTNNYEGDLYYGNQKPNKSNHKGRFPTDFLGTFKRILQKNSPKSVDDEITKKMVLTYSNENDNILDMTCCDKNNGNIAKDLKRNYIGVDISDEFLTI
tara:strand:- start:736 stop:1416 length:681 start_codon:yes stop_codon:yes gene_type:complete